MITFHRTVLLLVLVMCASSLSSSQSALTPIKDSTAVQLAGTALNAMTPNFVLNDITLSAQVSHGPGSNAESGEATLEALSSGQASITYLVSGDQHAEMFNPASDPCGAWAGEDGSWHRMAVHNTWIPAAWFAPSLVLTTALSDSQLELQNVGSTILNGTAVNHLRSWRVLPSISGSPADLALIQGFSTLDIYLDGQSNLPVALFFNLHPDSNGGVNIPVEILYSNWQKSSGALMPFHIQKFLNGSLLDDISVSSVTMNSGISSSSFNVPATVVVQ